MPTGFEMRPVDRALLRNGALKNLGDLIEEMQSERPSVEHFLSRPFGFCLVGRGEIIGWRFDRLT